jgi:hypothetical protein
MIETEVHKLELFCVHICYFVYIYIYIYCSRESELDGSCRYHGLGYCNLIVFDFTGTCKTRILTNDVMLNICVYPAQ